MKDYAKKPSEGKLGTSLDKETQFTASQTRELDLIDPAWLTN